MKGRLWRNPFFIRLFHWEYWSFRTVYMPIYPIWIWLAIKARSFFFFSAANPTIKNGGFLCESKKDIHAIMPPHLYPATMHFLAGESPESVLAEVTSHGFHFPLIGKPDTGGRGRGIKLLENGTELIDYVKNCLVDFHVQRFIDYPNEVGIFYYRYPGKDKGNISGIVRKEFLTVTGDGNSSVRELLYNDERALLQVENLERMYGEYLGTVLMEGEKKLLVPYGNHARGAKFLDDSHLVDEQLEKVINDICAQVDEFYYGRLDIRYNSWEELKQGRNFSVIEVNGAGAEPTHMYDPRHGIFFAWKEIVRHWFILNRISILNHKRGVRYLSVKEGLAMFREDNIHSEKLTMMSP